MQLRHWPATTLSLVFLLAAPGLALAQGAGSAQLPQACVDAGATNPAACRAILGRGKAPAAEPQPQPKPQQAPQPAAQQPPAEQPAQKGRRAQSPAPGEQQAPPPEAQTKGGPGNQLKMRNRAETPQEAAPANNNPASNPAANAPAAQQNQQPRRAHLPRDCVAAGISTQDECNAFRAGNSKPKQQVQNEQPAAKPAEPAKAPAAAAKPAPQAIAPAPAPTANEPAAGAPNNTGAPATAAPGGQRNARLARDCVAAGAKTQAECDAFHAINTQKGKGQPPAGGANRPGQPPTAETPAPQQNGNAPAPSTAQQPGATAPAKEVSGQPVEVIPNLPKGVSKDAVAPLFDSAKDQETGKGPGRQQPAQQGQARPGRNLPPPVDDKAAQSDLKPVKINPIEQTKGQQIEAGAGVPQMQLPPNVTIINNAQNNGAPGMQQNGGQRPGRGNGPRPGEFGPGGMAGNGQDHGRRGGQDNPNPIGLGLGVILQLGNQMIINSPAQDQRRIGGRPDDHTAYERLPGGNYRETIARPGGVRVVTVYNRNGDILRRSRFDANGREIVLAYFDAQHDQDLLDWRDPGEELPPLQLDIPPQDYVLDADNADEQQVQQFFAQPPVEQVQRLYSIDEVKRSARIRDMVRRLEIGDLTFDTGAATIAQDQVGNLANVAQAMLALLQKNPAETFLIEGHTDAVGTEVSNLELSDERAATVAQILTDFYHIPPENLATQGYGERFLIVQTDGPEQLNRRVTIRRITSLVTVANQNY